MRWFGIILMILGFVWFWGAWDADLFKERPTEWHQTVRLATRSLEVHTSLAITLIGAIFYCTSVIAKRMERLAALLAPAPLKAEAQTD